MGLSVLLDPGIYFLRLGKFSVLILFLQISSLLLSLFLFLWVSYSVIVSMLDFIPEAS